MEVSVPIYFRFPNFKLNWPNFPSNPRVGRGLKISKNAWAIWIQGQKCISQLIWCSLCKFQINWETLTCIIYTFTIFLLVHLYSNLVNSLLSLVGNALEMLPEIGSEVQPWELYMKRFFVKSFWPSQNNFIQLQ